MLLEWVQCTIDVFPVWFENYASLVGCQGNTQRIFSVTLISINVICILP